MPVMLTRIYNPYHIISYYVLHVIVICMTPVHSSIHLSSPTKRYDAMQFTSYIKEQPSKLLSPSMYNSGSNNFLPTLYSTGTYFCVSNYSSFIGNQQRRAVHTVQCGSVSPTRISLK